MESKEHFDHYSITGTHRHRHKWIAEFTSERGEVVSQVRFRDLLVEKVRFVEKEDHGGFPEPGVGVNQFKQGKTLAHPVLIFILKQHLCKVSKSNKQ